jgi:site-specific recombinase XerD
LGRVPPPLTCRATTIPTAKHGRANRADRPRSRTVLGDERRSPPTTYLGKVVRDAERTFRLDLDAPLIGAFLHHLETERGNSARTRNARLAAIHSLFGYAALQHPEDAAIIARVLAIPAKRFDRTVITYLSEDEIDALLAAPDGGTWTGRRDHG